jgi:hypothetical protein
MISRVLAAGDELSIAEATSVGDSTYGKWPRPASTSSQLPVPRRPHPVAVLDGDYLIPLTPDHQGGHLGSQTQPVQRTDRLPAVIDTDRNARRNAARVGGSDDEQYAAQICSARGEPSPTALSHDRTRLPMPSTTFGAITGSTNSAPGALPESTGESAHRLPAGSWPEGAGR